MNPTTAFCHCCRRDTPTILLSLSGGLIGNCCAVCRTCRKGRPYVSHREYKQHLDAQPGRRGHHGRILQGQAD